MDTSAEQIHQGKLNVTADKSEGKKLFIDLDICDAGECKGCVIKCSYYHHRQIRNKGIVSVAELATYALICRRCEEPHCVAACPADALEQNKDKDRLLARHNMRCISCKTCSHACPYGTIYPENVPFLIHNCDFCMGRRDVEEEPVCIASCPYGALSIEESGRGRDEHTFLAGDNLIVHSMHWEREKA